MAREKQFSEVQVLDEVADLFTAHGYQGTSLAMLLDATGLGKQSLYNCFGDKRALYLKSIDCSSARYQAVNAQMQATVTGRAAVELFFNHVVGKCDSEEAAHRSCIVASGLLEAVDDALIVQTLRAKWAASHEMLRAAVERGQKDGSIHNPAPSATLADLLLALMAGLRVNARAEFGADRLQRSVDLALAVLDSG
jgi:TetR/AcrR family transcriptional regulator, transcriptional repressor for nem operon